MPISVEKQSETHYEGSNNMKKNQATVSTSVKQSESKIDKKKEKAKNALFAGITDNKESSSSDSDDEKPAKIEEPAVAVDDLLSFGSTSST